MWHVFFPQRDCRILLAPPPGPRDSLKLPYMDLGLYRHVMLEYECSDKGSAQNQALCLRHPAWGVAKALVLHLTDSCVSGVPAVLPRHLEFVHLCVESAGGNQQVLRVLKQLRVQCPYLQELWISRSQRDASVHWDPLLLTGIWPCSLKVLNVDDCTMALPLHQLCVECPELQRVRVPASSLRVSQAGGVMGWSMTHLYLWQDPDSPVSIDWTPVQSSTGHPRVQHLEVEICDTGSSLVVAPPEESLFPCAQEVRLRLVETCPRSVDVGCVDAELVISLSEAAFPGLRQLRIHMGPSVTRLALEELPLCLQHIHVIYTCDASSGECIVPFVHVDVSDSVRHSLVPSLRLTSNRPYSHPHQPEPSANDPSLLPLRSLLVRDTDHHAVRLL